MRRPRVRVLRVPCCPTSSSGRVRSPSFCRSRLPVISLRVLLRFSMGAGHVLGRHCFLFNSLEGLHLFLPLSCQFSQYCSCAWAIRQLSVEDAIRRRISQYRHAIGYARSATMTDGSLTIFLEPMEVVTRIKHESLKERTKPDTTMCQEGMSGSLRSRVQCPYLYCQSTPPPRAHFCWS